MVEIGSGAKRQVTDIRLPRYACYLIVQNGDQASAFMIEHRSVLDLLPQDKAQAAVNAARAGSQGGPGRGQGRRSQDGATGLRRRTVSLDDATWAAAKVLGDGDASCGLRRAVSLAAAANHDSHAANPLGGL